MVERTIVLTDFDTNLQRDELSIGPSAELTLAGSRDWHVSVRTLRGGESQGVMVVELCNGPLTLAILPTRGMSVWKGRFGNLPLEWKSPVRRPVHPLYVDLHDRNGLGWLNGFNELMVRCGLGFNGPPGDDDGTAVTLHGKIGNLPAHYVSLTIDTAGPGTLTLTGVVDETTMFGPCYRLTSTMRLEAGSNSVSFNDEIENIGGAPAALSLLYHINIGRPFLDAGARNAIAFQELAPRDAVAAAAIEQHAVYEGPTVGFAEQAYYYVPAADASGWSTALLHNQAADAGFAVHYNARQLPQFVVWKNTRSEAEGYVTGLEPAVNFPNFRAFERQQQRLPTLSPGESYRTSLRWELTDSAPGVAEQLARVASLHADVSPCVHSQPQPGWSPAGDNAAEPVSGQKMD